MPQHNSSQPTADSLRSFLIHIEQENASALAADQKYLKEMSGEQGLKRIPHISFLHGGEKMLIPLSYVLDVGHLTAITPLPHLPVWLLGVVQLQGDILPVVDLATLFEFEAKKRADEQDVHAMAYLLYSWQGTKVCLIVEKITEVINIDPEQRMFFPLNANEKKRFSKLSPFLYGSIPTGTERAFLLNLGGIMKSADLSSWRTKDEELKIQSGTGR